MNSFSPSCGSLGGASTLGVLYEDPEEDLVSLLAEDDKKRLIIEEDSSDEEYINPQMQKHLIRLIQLGNSLKKKLVIFLF